MTRHEPAERRTGLARCLSKLGLASRTSAAQWIRAGRVSVNGARIFDPEHPVRMPVDRIAVDGDSAARAPPCVIMLNKPRGLVTSARDERDRATVYSCLEGAELPWLAPVGRLDKASEGLLLFSNDPEWSAAVTTPGRGPTKRYHVQIDRWPTASLPATLEAGIEVDFEHLAAKSATLLRRGTRHAWLDVELDEGRNRQIRRLLAAAGVGVLRLVRVSIGTLSLGNLPKGAWRHLSLSERESLLHPRDDCQRMGKDKRKRDPRHKNSSPPSE